MVNLIKLTNGIEIVGRIIQDTDNSIKVNNPLQINYFQQKASQTTPMVALQRYMPFAAEEDVVFKKEHIMNVSSPVQGLDEYYGKVLSDIKLNVDANIVAGLMDASDQMTEVAEQDKELYLAILERMAHKRPLN